jgi:hypothetical protein
LLRVLGLCVALLLGVSPVPAAEQWYGQFVGEQVSEPAIQLAVALELREVEIPGDPRRPGDVPEAVSLHIRLETTSDAIVVSLWDRGELAGHRRVSKGGHARVLARRVGLAVGELARQLSARRSRLVQELQRDTFLAQEQEKEFQRLRRLHDLGLRADFQGLMFAGDAYLLGPSIGIEFNDHFPARFSTGLAWMAGGIPALSNSTLAKTNPSWSLFDLWLRMDHAWALSDPAWMTAGVDVAVSAVHVGGATEVDGIAFQRDTYTARLGGRFGYAHSFTETLRVRAEFSGGSLLRSIPMQLGSERINLGGAYLGLHLGVTLAPQGDD